MQRKDILKNSGRIAGNAEEQPVNVSGRGKVRQTNEGNAVILRSLFSFALGLFIVALSIYLTYLITFYGDTITQ